PSHLQGEVFDPATRTFQLTGPTHTYRHGFATIPLPKGNALIVGGHSNPDNPQESAIREIELFDPEKQAFEVLGKTHYLYPRRPSLTLLPNGRVLVLGKEAGEILDPATGQTVPLKQQRPSTTWYSPGVLLP